MSQWDKCVSNTVFLSCSRSPLLLGSVLLGVQTMVMVLVWIHGQLNSSMVRLWQSDSVLNWPDCRKWTRPWHALWIAGSFFVDASEPPDTNRAKGQRCSAAEMLCSGYLDYLIKKIENKKAWCKSHFHFIYHLCRDGSVSPYSQKIIISLRVHRFIDLFPVLHGLFKYIACETKPFQISKQTTLSFSNRHESTQAKWRRERVWSMIYERERRKNRK